MQHDAGAWLWCSKDDLVIDAVRKVRRGKGAEERCVFCSLQRLMAGAHGSSVDFR